MEEEDCAPFNIFCSAQDKVEVNTFPSNSRRSVCAIRLNGGNISRVWLIDSKHSVFRATLFFFKQTICLALAATQSPRKTR